MNRHNKLLSPQAAGMVSILVTMIMMLVISLIVLGFAQVSRREQRESLDRQLSSQAFFAAESGVNDARDKISAIPVGTDIPEKTSCGPDSTYSADPNIDTANDVSYTCLLVTSKLKDITINPLNVGDHSVNMPLEPDGAMTSLHIVWNALGTPTPAAFNACKTAVPANAAFPTTANWGCGYGVLRLDIVPTSILSRAAMASTNPAGQKTMFFYPTRGGSASTVALTNGAVARMSCAITTGCAVDVTGVTAAKYALRVTALYANGSTVISARNGPTILDLKNAQVQVDATGKAHDVLRRIQVRLPLNSTSDSPDYAIESGSSICKRFSENNTTFIIPSDIVGQDQNNPMCRVLSVNPPTPTPTPTPAPGGGVALIKEEAPTCGGSGQPACNATPVNGAYHYDASFTNASNNPAGSVASCSWSYGDGSPVLTYPGTDPICQLGGQSATHTYPKLNPEPPYPKACFETPGSKAYYKVYTAKLTVNLKNGTTASDTHDFTMPFCY